MNLDDARVLAELHMEAHGLLAKGWHFRFDRAIKRFGYCHEGRKLISMSASMVLLNVEKEVENTILHEVAHALVGCRWGHCAAWAGMAAKLGARPEACWKASDGIRCRYRWEALCPGCKEVRDRRMRPPPRIQSCSKCSGGKFNPEFRLQWRYAPEGDVRGPQ